MTKYIILIMTCIILMGTSMQSAREDSFEMFKKERISVTKSTDLECLAQTIFYEAGNQSREGKEAVSLVVLNRVKSSAYANSVCEVVRTFAYVGKRKVCQFSYFCELTKPRHGPEWNESLLIAGMNLSGIWLTNVRHRLRNATHFHATYVSPRWSTRLRFLAKIGDHKFYSLRNI